MILPGFLDYHQPNFLPKQGSLEYLYPFLKESDCERYFLDLYHNVEWIQDEMEIYEKIHPLPRLVAWYDETVTWRNVLLEMKVKIESFTGLEFNTVLLNLYRNQKDHVSWHSDKYNNPEDVKYIVSISLGETRKFQIKHKTDKTIPLISLELLPGSLVIMKEMQQHWLHRVALTTKPKGPRINLTFRNIKRT